MIRKIVLPFVFTLPSFLLIAQTNTTSEDDNNESRSGDYSVYIGSYTGVKATSGAGFNTIVGSYSGYNNTSGDHNTFVGGYSGFVNTSSYNTFIGSYSGVSNTSGMYNTFVGDDSGYRNTTGSHNTFIGQDAGQANSTGTYNTFLGRTAGYYNTASYNTFVGYYAGYANTSGAYNTFIGEDSGDSNTSGGSNTFIGQDAGQANTTASYNTFLGKSAGYYNTASYNTFLGYYSGYANTTGTYNTFVGRGSGDSNTTGSYNTFIGYYAGQANTTASYNTFVGQYSGYVNTTGAYNTFVGRGSGDSNTTGGSNTFLGYLAGQANTTASYNTFVGQYSGYLNTTGAYNTFVGDDSGDSNTTGAYNTFIGRDAGQANTTASSNTFVGHYAGYINSTGANNTFVGEDSGDSNTTGGSNTFIGQDAGQANTTASNNTFLGRAAGYSNTTGAGNTFLGYQAGYNETGSNKLYIDNSSTSTPLIWGDFSAHDVRINGDLDITEVLTIDYAKVNGTANRSGLLEIAQNGSNSWSGISIEHTSTSAWSFMGDQDDAGLYDDYNNEWAILYNENAGVDLYHNGGVKLSTSSDGVDVNGNLYADDIFATSLTAEDVFTTSLTAVGVNTDYIKFTNREVTDMSQEVGVMYYDLNVHSDTDNGIYQHFTGGNGGAVSYYSTEDGWGALLSTNNMKWITPQFDSLGIGIADPQARLSVAGTIRGASDNFEEHYIEMSHNGSNAVVNAFGRGRMDFIHEGDTANVPLTILESGTVGIGTSDPSEDFALDVNGEIVTNGLAIENAMLIDAGDTTVYFRHQTDTALAIVDNKGQLSVELPTEVTFGGGINLNRDQIWDDPTMDDLLVVEPGSGRLKRRSAKSIESPWLFEVVDTLLIVGQDGEVVGEAEGGGAIQVDIIDLYGNISIGPNAYIDDDWMVGNDYYVDSDSLAADDWMKFSDFIEFQSSHNDNGIVLHDNNPYTYDYLNLFHNNGISYFANGANEDYFMKAQGFEVEFRDKVKLPEVRTSVASSDSAIYLIADVNNIYDDTTAMQSIVFGKNGDPLDPTNGTYRELMRIEETGNIFVKNLLQQDTLPDVVVRDYNTGQLYYRDARTISPWEEWPSGNLTYNEGTVGIGMSAGEEAAESLEVGSGNLRVWELGSAPFTTATDRVIVTNTSGTFQVRDAYTFSPWTWTLGGSEMSYGSNIFFNKSGSITGLNFYGSMFEANLVRADSINGTDVFAENLVATQVEADDIDVSNLDAMNVAIRAENGTVGLRLVNDQYGDNSYGQDVFRVYGDGYILAKEMRLKIDGWEDRVFEPSYDLMPLEEVEEYVVENKHLPEVPSEKEVLEKGVEVADMERLLLKKVEELTLHLIEQNKQMKAQSERIAELEKLVQETKN